MPNAWNDGAGPGFRLARFEVFNWGTFHGRVWKLEPGGENSLLTGDIGSGKSTLVDALTTLLVPPRRITYNKAAGAEARERTFYSYVRGEFRSVSNELTGGAQAQALRGDDSYSVLLAVFADPPARREVTLAQVFWLKPGERNPQRFYVVAPAALSIAGDFSDFGTDIQKLRKRLRGNRAVALFDSFEEYGGRVCRELGIPHAQALELFYQTVSMKSVGNLTEFVRHHMLEADDTAERIRTLISNFENLNHAHDAVVRARDQIERLTPLIADGVHLTSLEDGIAALRGARHALEPWFAGHRAHLLEARIAELEFEQAKCTGQLEGHKARLQALSRERADVQAAIERHGGGRLRELEARIAPLLAERERRREDESAYRRLCGALELKPGTTLEAFLTTARTAQARRTEFDSSKADLDRQAIDKAVEFREHGERDQALSREIQSLETRADNIPAETIRIRDALAEAVGVESGELPFVGELLQVRREEAAWEGAMERLLHGFALSLLVPDALYASVSHYVDATHLRGRLVFLRVRDEPARTAAPRASSPDAVARKLSIKPDSAFYTFLERTLAEQFDHVCCDSLEQFRRLPKAITLNGLIKARDHRHEKDDRFRLDDRSRFVLGWDNRAKLKALREEQKELRRRMLAVTSERDAMRREAGALEQKLRAAERLLELTDYARIDWRSVAADIARLEEEKRALEESNDLLKTLRARQEELNRAYADEDLKRDALGKRSGALETQLTSAVAERGDAQALEAGLDLEARRTAYPLLEEWRERALSDRPFELRLLDSQQQTMRERHAGEDRRRRQDRGAAAREHRRADAALQGRVSGGHRGDGRAHRGAAGIRRRLKALTDDDLPRFEARFKELLNKDTINGMAAFQAQLQRRRQEIQQRIRIINARSPDRVRSRAGTLHRARQRCTRPTPTCATSREPAGLHQRSATTSGEQYTEQKFLQVKAIVERFSGREGQTELDARWRAKVTDVRNWFVFSRHRALARRRHGARALPDSGGKSGGQKEKLAYTVLAASLAYQFGLERSEHARSSFRFVVIDEAFGRGSDESRAMASSCSGS